MAFDVGFDFRGTLGFVTDPLFGVAVLGESYPHTYTNANGDSINAGWDSGVSFYDNNATYDARLAGANYHVNDASQPKFVVDLSSGSAPGAGTYLVDLAAGDGGTQDFKVYDNTTVLIDGTNGGSGYPVASVHWIDASLANVVSGQFQTWPGTPVLKTFASTTAKLGIAVDAPGNITTLAHFRLTLQGGTSTNITPDTGSASLVGYQPTLTGQMTITTVFSDLGDQGFIAFQAQQILLVEASLDGVTYHDITALGRAVTGAILFSHVAFFFYRVTSVGAIVYTTGADKATIN